MENNEMTFLEYVVDFINDELDNLEGEEVYLPYLSERLTSMINDNGSLHCQFMLEEIRQIVVWWCACGDFVEYQRNEGVVINPFDYPSRFLVQMVTEAVRAIIQNCPTAQKDDRDGLIKFTPEVIAKIKGEVVDGNIDWLKHDYPNYKIEENKITRDI